MASRLAAQYYDVLSELRESDSQGVLRDSCVPGLLKAMVVHGASWGESYGVFESILRNEHNSRTFKEHVGRFLGYGGAATFLLAGCTEERATLLGCGDLADGQAHLYSVPLPPSLNGKLVWRRLTITLAWLSPTKPTTRKYRAAALWFEPPTTELEVKRQGADWQAAKRGTVQHEVLEGDKAAVFESDSALQIKINCRADAGPFKKRIPYGLAVSLQVAEGEEISIYEEIRSRILARIRPKP